MNDVDDNVMIDDAAEYVLYVGRDHRSNDDAFCRGSQLCIRMVENMGLQDDSVVQDCDALRRRGVRFPDWLCGTPTLVERSTLVRWIGTGAVDQISSMRRERTPAPVEHRTPRHNVEWVPSPEPAAPPTPPPRRDAPPSSAWSFEDEPDGGGDMLAPGNILSSPPPDDGAAGAKRVTESDVNKFLAERKRMDAMMQQQQAPPQAR